MRLFIKLAFLVLIFLVSCKNLESTKEADRQELIEKFKLISGLSKSISCTNAKDWVFTPFGAKACGGPSGYITYSINIDVEYFQTLVLEYTTAEQNYNEKWNVISDCTVVQSPDAVICDDGLPKLVY